MSFRLPVLWLLVFDMCSCSTEYAKVRVVTIDASKGSVSLRIFDAKSGLLLGDGLTPADFVLTKKSSDNNPTLSIVVVDKCYPMKWKMVEITKWTTDEEELSKAKYYNQIQLTVVEDKDCYWDIQ